MSNGASFNYKFGPKNNWRRTAWNKITERLSVKPRDAVVLYLAGERDLDRRVAIQKGFREENLIAIDRESKIVAKLRKEKKLAVKADIGELVRAWSGLRVDVIFADLCCGCSIDCMALAMRLQCKREFSSAVIAFNLMRGREGGKTAVIMDDLRGKHRGAFIYSIQVSTMTESGAALIGVPFRPEMASWAEQNSNPFFDEYKSHSGQVFDSAIWRNISFFGFYEASTIEQNRYFEKHGLPVRNSTAPGFSEFDSANPLSRQISAIRAVRTMRAAA